jgi:pimeloyl-ACP methyl ester carboxylesterase
MKWSIAVALSVIASSFAVEATAGDRTVVYVHGRTESGWSGGFRAPTGYKTLDLRYNGTTATLAQANVGVTAELRKRCSGGNVCVVVAHSNGTLQVGRTVATAPDAIDGLLYVEATGAAMGGSELIDSCGLAKLIGQSCYPNGVDATLTVTAARAAFDHNSHVPWYHLAGNTDFRNRMWWLTAAMLPGNDDGVVAYHSALGCANAGSQTLACRRYEGHFMDTACDVCVGGECGGIDHFGIAAKGTRCF